VVFPDSIERPPIWVNGEEDVCPELLAGC
jgi:hypothetical protein